MHQNWRTQGASHAKLMQTHLIRTSAAFVSAALLAVSAVALKAQSGPCAGLPVITATAPASGGEVQIAVAAEAGCAWTVDSSDLANATPDPATGTGSDTVTVTVAPNDDVSRDFTMTLAGKPFLIHQLGINCEYTITANPALVPASGGTASFSIATAGGAAPCTWTARAFTRSVTISGGPDPQIDVIDTQAGWVTVAGTGPGTATVSVSPNATPDTRSVYLGVIDGASGEPGANQFGEAKTLLTQAGQPGPVTPWGIGDVFVGIGSSFATRGKYQVMTPAGSVAGSNLLDPFASTPLLETGGVTTGCMIDPSVPNGDLWTTSWDGLRISRFSDATHQLIAMLDLSPSGLSSLQRKDGLPAVPQAMTLVDGVLAPDFAYSEQLVFTPTGEFFVGGSYPANQAYGLGHAYLLKFARNDDPAGHPIAGCGAAGPCLLDWWRVDAAGELPVGQSPEGANAAWTKEWKRAYSEAGGTDADKAAAAQAAVASLAPTVSYNPSEDSGQVLPATSGVDEIDLSADGHTIFYTSEDGYIRKFDTASGNQLAPLAITGADAPHPLIGGKAYGFRLLPEYEDGSGIIAGSGGLIVALSGGVARLDQTGRNLKPAGSTGIDFTPPGGWGVAHPFALNLAPDAQSFWVATSQENAFSPSQYGGKIYRFHIASRMLLGAFNTGPAGADIDIQGLCVRNEFLANVNTCVQTDKDGKGVPGTSGECSKPAICSRPGVDENGQPTLYCLPPGIVPSFTGVPADQVRPVNVALPAAPAVTISASDPVGLPLVFTFACATAAGVPNGAGCDPATGLPAGLTASAPVNTSPLERSVTITGTPTALATNLRMTVFVSDIAGATVTQPATITWTIYGAPTVSASPQKSPAGTALTYTPAAASTPPGLSLTYAFAALPPGLTGNASTGVIAGTPATTGSYSPTVTVTQTIAPGLTSSASATFSWIVYALTVQNQTTFLGTPASYQPVFSPAMPVTWQIDNLPAGLTSNTTTGLMTGTPTAAGVSTVSVKVSDASGPLVTKTFTWSVVTNRAPVCSAATVTPSQIWPPNHKLVPFVIQNVVDPDRDRVMLTITSITQDQPIDGEGDGSTLVDGIGVGFPLGAVRAERTGNLRVPDDGRLYQVNFTATDPSGASCAGSMFIGVPHDQGQHNLPSDNGCRWDSTNGTPLTPCAWLHAPALDVPDRTSYESDAVSLQLTADDDDGTPLTFTIGGLPPGLSMTPSGLITGTVAAGAAGGTPSKNYTVTATVNDGYGADTDTFVWTIKPRPSSVVVLTIPDQVDDETDVVSLQVSAVGPAGSSFTYSLVPGSTLPAGLTLNAATGKIAGTIATGAAGSGTRTYSITVKATNGSSSDTDTFAWTVKTLSSGHGPGDGCGNLHHDGDHRDDVDDHHDDSAWEVK
jgi:hypothetical protein